MDRRAQANCIDLICDEFEQSLRAGQHPRIEDFLERSPDVDQDELLQELLGLEIEIRCQVDGAIDSKEYAARFPQAAGLVSDLRMHESIATDYLSIASLPLFLATGGHGSGLSLSAPLAELQRLAGEMCYAPGEPLVRQGEVATSLMVIREGAVEIRVVDHDGTAHVIGQLGPGQVLGEMALLTLEPRTASAVAIDSVRAAVLPVKSFHKLCQRFPQLSSLLTELIADRLGNTQQDALTSKQLDRYRIRRRLGRGGMSVVYQALDTATEATVALKMMSHRLVCSPAALRRFQLEADIIERFDHPHIVKMLGRFAAFRTYFIAMEYCAGETLATHIRQQGALDESAFRQAFRQLAMPLQHAHEAGIIHRDLKPSNVMRLPDGTLKLMDFGLAEPITTESTLERDISGTPRYMAPEQRSGDSVDPRADYFSLGCTAYELLTGVPLFNGSINHELKRDFGNWQPPDFSRLAAVDLSAETARMLQPLVAVDPAARHVDLRGFSAW